MSLNHVHDPTPEGPRRRPATFLGRLTGALRDQNWVAVVIEIGVVVIGVVIGFQVTTWGQARADVAKEQTYLRQLHADLLESEEGLEEVVQNFQRRADGATGVAHAFWQTDRPPLDSLAMWMLRPFANERYRPILGTAEAIVSTGDLRLVSDDSLRAVIVEYIDSVEAALDDVRRYEETYYRPAIAGLRQEFDPNVLMFMRDSTRVRSGGIYSIPQNYNRIPFPIDFDSILNNRRVYDVYQQLLLAHRNTGFLYVNILEFTQELRAHVERALER